MFVENLDFAFKVRMFIALALLPDDRTHDMFGELQKSHQTLLVVFRKMTRESASCNFKEQP